MAKSEIISIISAYFILLVLTNVFGFFESTLFCEKYFKTACSKMVSKSVTLPSSGFKLTMIESKLTVALTAILK